MSERNIFSINSHTNHFLDLDIKPSQKNSHLPLVEYQDPNIAERAIYNIACKPWKGFFRGVNYILYHLMRYSTIVLATRFVQLFINVIKIVQLNLFVLYFQFVHCKHYTQFKRLVNR